MYSSKGNVTSLVYNIGEVGYTSSVLIDSSSSDILLIGLLGHKFCIKDHSICWATIDEDLIYLLDHGFLSEMRTKFDLPRKKSFMGFWIYCPSNPSLF